MHNDDDPIDPPPVVLGRDDSLNAARDIVARAHRGKQLAAVLMLQAAMGGEILPLPQQRKKHAEQTEAQRSDALAKAAEKRARRAAKRLGSPKESR